MSYRAIKYLNDNRIVYRKYSEDQPTKEFDWGWYYADGTHGYYSLFNSDARINTIKSLKWHLLTLWWLNPSIDKTKFDKLAMVITHKPNGFVTFSISNLMLNNIINDIYMQDLDRPPKNKLRKVVFKDNSGLSKKQKLSIVGKLIGRKSMIDEEAIYQCMLDLNHDGKKITISRIAGLLDCSSRTIHRSMNDELRKEKNLLNIENEKI
tara:strand:- start:1471 stop:2094 length:624 start_codon:yes stop_codon:yes gene_type:complete